MQPSSLRLSLLYGGKVGGILGLNSLPHEPAHEGGLLRLPLSCAFPPFLSLEAGEVAEQLVGLQANVQGGRSSR